MSFAQKYSSFSKRGLFVFFVLSSIHALCCAQGTNQDPFAKAGFSEDPLVLPTELPKSENLKFFRPSAETALQFAIDSKSLKIGKDGVLRYVVVITNPNGTQQIKFEGILCESFEYKVFAILQENQSWKISPDSSWKLIPNQGYNQYQAALGRGGFCVGESANANFNQIFETLR
jgi:hypothetical protein